MQMIQQKKELNKKWIYEKHISIFFEMHRFLNMSRKQQYKNEIELPVNTESAEQIDSAAETKKIQPKQGARASRQTPYKSASASKATDRE